MPEAPHSGFPESSGSAPVSYTHLDVYKRQGKESTLMIVIERTAQSITHFVRESSNTRHLISIGFHCQRIFRQDVYKRQLLLSRSNGEQLTRLADSEGNRQSDVYKRQYLCSHIGGRIDDSWDIDIFHGDDIAGSELMIYRHHCFPRTYI